MWGNSDASVHREYPRQLLASYESADLNGGPRPGRRSHSQIFVNWIVLCCTESRFHTLAGHQVTSLRLFETVRISQRDPRAFKTAVRISWVGISLARASVLI
jgi:hypothetical protein